MNVQPKSLTVPTELSQCVSNQFQVVQKSGTKTATSSFIYYVISYSRTEGVPVGVHEFILHKSRPRSV